MKEEQKEMTYASQLIENVVEKNKLKLIVSLSESIINNLLKIRIVQMDSEQNAKGNGIIRVEFSSHLSRNFTVEMHTREGQHFLWGVNPNPGLEIPLCDFIKLIGQHFQDKENELDELECKTLHSFFEAIILELKSLPTLTQKKTI